MVFDVWANIASIPQPATFFGKPINAKPPHVSSKKPSDQLIFCSPLCALSSPGPVVRRALSPGILFPRPLLYRLRPCYTFFGILLLPLPVAAAFLRRKFERCSSRLVFCCDVVKGFALARCLPPEFARSQEPDDVR